ncbi:MAG: 2-amino-4-hydroxy-6-hydroxymethyldihydropteridine diphosphokinase [Thauera sp.]|nr:2-amino-4-hydroxy-6-hydroxymethyldihydropteridine diphosphokinase [Thauera sp.]
MQGGSAQADTVRAYVAFGANLGDPQSAFALALERLAALPGTRVVAQSSLYRSAPIGVDDGHPDYVNAVVAIDTALAPRALLESLLAIEREGGRTRHAQLAPRTLDLDLLLYGEATIAEPGLIVPHPRMHERAFVLHPLAEIAPMATIPGVGVVAGLLNRVADQSIAPL